MAEIQQAINQTQMGQLAEVQMGARGIRIRVKGALLFDAGSAELRPQAKPFLDNLVLVLQKYPYFLLVEGHTDSTPISTPLFPSNWELSSHRAAAVLRYLMTWGIEPGRMTSVGLADNYPLDTNETTEGRAKNRRVEFVLTKQSFRPDIS
ncbi:MAG: OmpA family protein [Thermodesulfobacteriota bacterium]